MKNRLSKKMRVFLIEYLICSLSVLLYFTIDGLSILAIIYAWLLSHLGHFTQFIVASYMIAENPSQWITFIAVVVVNVVGILIYIIRPNVITAVLSFLGMATWFYYGVFAILMGV